MIGLLILLVDGIIEERTGIQRMYDIIAEVVVFLISRVIFFYGFQIFAQSVVEIGNGFAQHLLHIRAAIFTECFQVCEMTKARDDMLCDIAIVGHTREPGEASVRSLHLQQFIECFILFVGHPG